MPLLRKKIDHRALFGAQYLQCPNDMVSGLATGGLEVEKKQRVMANRDVEQSFHGMV